MYASQLPQIKTIIETFSESIALREQLASNEAKVCTILNWSAIEQRWHK
jgi:hypothetical protein